MSPYSGTSVKRNGVAGFSDSSSRRLRPVAERRRRQRILFVGGRCARRIRHRVRCARTGYAGAWRHRTVRSELRRRRELHERHWRVRRESVQDIGVLGRSRQLIGVLGEGKQVGVFGSTSDPAGLAGRFKGVARRWRPERPWRQGRGRRASGWKSTFVLRDQESESWIRGLPARRGSKVEESKLRWIRISLN